MISVTRTHEICAGHRVVGHEGKCRFLHGHNYRFELTLVADELDSVGRVIDFSVIKSALCNYLEDNFDHKFLMWEEDELVDILLTATAVTNKLFSDSIVVVPFNPTAENIAEHICTIAPDILVGTGARLIEVKLWETSKCCATYRVKEENDKPFRNGRKDVATKKSRFEESVQET